MKILQICKEALPIVVMIALIPFIENDYLLAVIYLIGSMILLSIRKQKYDIAVFIFGLIVLTISESFFILTGVEVFKRTSLFGLMPIWLPFLWAYAFVAIKRSIRIIES